MASGVEAVKVAFFVNLGIFIIKLAAALITRSAGMLAEAVHSFADTGNQVLLLLGYKRSQKTADDSHPFGYGKEEYFWSFIVAILLFTLGGVYSVYEGIHKLLHPEELKHLYINFAILGIAVAAEGYSWWVARKAIGGNSVSQIYDELVDSKDAGKVVVFVEDTGAMIGLFVALMGNLLAFLTHNPVYDAASSVIIGFLLLGLTYFLANEMRKLIIGERIDDAHLAVAKRIIIEHPHVKALGEIKSMQLGSGECIIAACVDFEDSLRDIELEKTMHSIRTDILSKVPSAKHIYIQLSNGACF
ncbi:MAG: cation diffusion facilitator family transporter [Deltaproteobacteria bacterium]|nr:cation diffusion facilitator family transporter [Deltaproteobacteria bacterium]